MCGIAGKIRFDSTPITPEEIIRMTDAIAHRGPDDAGVHISAERNVGLGHRRLAIIDLSPLGHQPMGYLGRYQIVFNGEIYNFQEERKSLERDGYVFASQCDTEVIMALYDKYKEKCLERLRGMFAFALYDEKENTLFCARDRVGKKPFKYYHDGNVFLFASELKAILTQKEYRREPDYEAVHHYLTYQYAPSPMTGFAGIQKLEPGHFLLIDISGKTVRKERYWKLDYREKLDLTENEWKKRILEKLEESVRLRMISDVPLGAFLSGGVDSSAVVAMMANISSSPVKTFSIGFREKQYDETGFARIVADRFRTDHTEYIVEPDKVEEILPFLVRQYEEPYADSSALPTYYVSKLTRKHVTVALNGDGGDENFGGYARYTVARPYPMLKPFLFAALPIFRLASRKSDFARKVVRLARLQGLSDARFYASLVCYFDPENKKRLYTRAFAKAHAGDSFDLMRDMFRSSLAKTPMDRIFASDVETYLADCLMPKVDIATMAVALEGRSPLLDHELLELSAKIPDRLKVRGMRTTKYIFKKALEGTLPNEILYRPKMGFGIPINAWFRGDARRYALSVILSKKALSRGIFRPQALKELLERHASGREDQGYRIWALLTLELWFREYFD